MILAVCGSRGTRFIELYISVICLFSPVSYHTAISLREGNALSFHTQVLNGIGPEWIQELDGLSLNQVCHLKKLLSFSKPQFSNL